jgi:hypothetical protein
MLIALAAGRHPSGGRSSGSVPSASATTTVLPPPVVFNGRTTSSPSTPQLPVRAVRSRQPNVVVASPPAVIPPLGARRAAASFLHSYLLYTYGHLSVDGLQAVTPALRARLAVRAAWVPPAVRSLHPVVDSLTLEQPDGPAWTAIATVADGQRTYVVVFTLTDADGWMAASLRPD